MDRPAQANNTLVISGASSVPCLTAAVIDQYIGEFESLTKLDYGIATAQQTNRGLATTSAVLSYAGKPFTTLINGAMRTVFLAMTLVLTFGAGITSAQGSDGRSALVGAWLITETTTTTADSVVSVNKNPQPGLYLFTDRHFSIMLIPRGDSPRAVLTEDASPEERLAALENFVADAGSYEATNSMLTMHNILAKLPRAMNSDAGGPYRYTLNGDSLTLTLNGGWARGGEITYRLVRLQ